MCNIWGFGTEPSKLAALLAAVAASIDLSPITKISTKQAFSHALSCTFNHTNCLKGSTQKLFKKKGGTSSQDGGLTWANQAADLRAM